MANDFYSVGIPTTKLLLGQGVNIVSAEPGGSAVIYEGKEDELTTTTGGTSEGAKVQFKCSVLKQMSDIRSKMGLSASASLGFGVFSGSATANFVHSMTMHSYYTFIFVDVSVEFPARLLRRSRLTEAALKRAIQKTASFLDYCGNTYVYGFGLGGRLTAVVEFRSKSKKEQESVKAAVEASVGPFGGGSASFAKTLQSIKSISETEIYLLRDGGFGDLPNVDSVVEAAQTFPEKAKLSRALTEVFVRSYNTVEDDLSGLVDFHLLENQAKTFQVIASNLERAYGIRADLNYVLQNTDQFKLNFGGDLVESANVAYQANENIIRDLNELHSKVSNNPEMNAPLPPQFPKLDVSRIDPPPPVVLLPPKPVVELFDKADYKGKSAKLLKSSSNLGSHGFNDKTSSLKINGKVGEYVVRFYLDKGYEKKILEIKSPAKIPELPSVPGIFNNSISSVKILRKQ